MFIIITSRVGVANSSVFHFDVSSHSHRVFLSRPSDVAKTVFSSFLHRSLYMNQCMLLHVVSLHRSSLFHLAFSFYHFGELFAVIHRFCIVRFDFSKFCSFCCGVHLLFIVFLENIYFACFSCLFSYNVIEDCVFHGG